MRLPIFDNDRMNDAWYRYAEAFPEKPEWGFFGARIDNRLAADFADLVELAIARKRPITQSEIDQLFVGVPEAGGQTVY